MTARLRLRSIISGGQTGADRAALDVAMALDLQCGGWVPAGRRAEDGVVPAIYSAMRETPTSDYAGRTRRNVRDADGTVVFAHGAVAGGTGLTVSHARRLGRPLLFIDLDEIDVATAATRLHEWLVNSGIVTLNVAGPRASEDPRIYAAVRVVLERALTGSREGQS